MAAYTSPGLSFSHLLYLGRLGLTNVRTGSLSSPKIAHKYFEGMKLGLVVWALLIHTLFDITFFLFFFNCHELAFTVIPNPKLKIERGGGGEIL